MLNTTITMGLFSIGLDNLLVCSDHLLLESLHALISPLICAYGATLSAILAVPALQTIPSEKVMKIIHCLSKTWGDDWSCDTLENFSVDHISNVFNLLEKRDIISTKNSNSSNHFFIHGIFDISFLNIILERFSSHVFDLINICNYSSRTSMIYFNHPSSKLFFETPTLESLKRTNASLLLPIVPIIAMM